jgi:hypothetical protein
MAVAVQPNRGREGVAAAIATSKRRADLGTTREGGKSAATPQIRARKGGREYTAVGAGGADRTRPPDLGTKATPARCGG